MTGGELKRKRTLIERLADSPTALVCNAYAFMGLHAPCADWSIRCMTPGFPAMVGEAITIKLDCSTPADEDGYEFESASSQGNRLYYELVERMGHTDLPKVVVIESEGNKSASAVLGDGMAKIFRAAGAVGCVTDGGVRDIQDICRVGLMTFGGGAVVNHFPLRWHGLGDPVSIGGLAIETGAIVHGDRDGIAVLPEAGWDKVVRTSRYVLDFEKAAHVLLRTTSLSPGEKEREVAVLADEYGAAIRAIDESDET